MWRVLLLLTWTTSAALPFAAGTDSRRPLMRARRHADTIDHCVTTEFDPLTEEGRARWMQLRRMIIEYFKIPSSRINQLKNRKSRYVSLKQGTMAMRKFIMLDDKMAKDLRNASGDNHV